MSTTKILPCPFCGQQPTEYAIEPHTHVLQFAGGKMPDHQGSHVIECACSCGMIEATREAVIALWNRRPTSADAAVKQAVRDYHFALDTRQHGGVAAGKALDAIQSALGMHWKQGAESATRAAQTAQQKHGGA